MRINYSTALCGARINVRLSARYHFITTDSVINVTSKLCTLCIITSLYEASAAVIGW